MLKLPLLICGRLAQLARAPRLHRGGRGFESLITHQIRNPPLRWVFDLLDMDLNTRPKGRGEKCLWHFARESTLENWFFKDVATGPPKVGRNPEIRTCIIYKKSWRGRLVAYGARLESVLGASPRGFESLSLRQGESLGQKDRAIFF